MVLLGNNFILRINYIWKEMNEMTTIFTAIIPFLLLLPLILFVRWLFTILINLKASAKKQVEQNGEIIALLKKLNEKEDGNISK
jgi:hypothetical protein